MGASRLYMQKSACRLTMQRHRGRDVGRGQATKDIKTDAGRDGRYSRALEHLLVSSHILYMEYPAHRTGPNKRGTRTRENMMHHEVVAFEL